MAIRIAAISDLQQLQNLYIRNDTGRFGELSPSEIVTQELKIRKHLEASLNSPLSRTWVSEENHEIVAMGMLTIFVRKALPNCPAAIEAYISDVYTAPEYRRRGLATAILSAAKSCAQTQGIQRVWLHATEAGLPVYSAAGFRNFAA